MLEGYKIIPFVPAGRKRTLEILVKYFLKHQEELDHVQLWLNTPVEEDIKYIRSLEKAHPDLFKVYELPEGHTFYSKSGEPGSKEWGPVQWNTGKFYEYTVDPEAIYIRFDDDIVWIDDDYFKNIVKFRVKYPEYFLVFGHIWNNAVSSYISQKEGTIGFDEGLVSEPYCMDMVGWGSGPFALYIHNILLDKIKEDKVKDLYWKGTLEHEDLVWNGDGYELHDLTRFSISNFAFFGRDFAKFGGKIVDLDEEIYLTEIHPARHEVLNVICGNAMVSHFTFSPYQKPYIMNNTDLLDQYGDLSKKMLSKDYYKMLNTHDV